MQGRGDESWIIVLVRDGSGLVRSCKLSVIENFWKN